MRDYYLVNTRQAENYHIPDIADVSLLSTLFVEVHIPPFFLGIVTPGRSETRLIASPAAPINLQCLNATFSVSSGREAFGGNFCLPEMQSSHDKSLRQREKLALFCNAISIHQQNQLLTPLPIFSRESPI